MKALALLELVFHLPRALFGLLEAAHRVGLLPVAEVDVAQVEVGAVKVLQQLAFPLSAKRRKDSRPVTRVPIVHGDEKTFEAPLLCDEDATAEEIAAALGLAEVIADQTQIEKETRLHLADLPRRHGPCSGGETENLRLKNQQAVDNSWHGWILYEEADLPDSRPRWPGFS